MKKAFISGMHRLLTVLQDDIAELPEEEFVATLEKLLHELELYIEGGWRTDAEFPPRIR
jgi:hypothetical protein